MQNDQTKPFEYGMLYTPQMKNAWVGGYLNDPQNYNKNFVQRIFQANPNVALSRPVTNGYGDYESLRMASNDRSIFPTIEFKNGGLQTLQRGQQPLETVNTTTPEQALMLGWNEYKRLNPDFGYKDKRDADLNEGSLEYLINANRNGLLGR